jgi:PhnB protein
MSVSITTHVNFRGQAREALAFYQSIFGGELSIATYEDIHAIEEPSQANQVAFGHLHAPNGFALMAYDVQPSKAYDPGTNAFYITLQGTNGDEIQPLWDALAESATILVQLAPAPFAPLYGMLTDRYAISWIVGADTRPDQQLIDASAPRRSCPSPQPPCCAFHGSQHAKGAVRGGLEQTAPRRR